MEFSTIFLSHLSRSHMRSTMAKYLKHDLKNKSYVNIFSSDMSPRCHNLGSMSVTNFVLHDKIKGSKGSEGA